MFSVIIPVYNRADEMEALLESLAAQTAPEGTFEVIAVDDGSSEPCADVCARYPFCSYYWKENQGRSIARNYAMERARGDYFIFFDSDCIIPPGYFQTLLSLSPLPDCFGGPDAAHESFTTLQKGINFAMTSFLTTGGIRGGKVSLEKFTPEPSIWASPGKSTSGLAASARCFQKTLTCQCVFGAPDSPWN